MKSVLRRSISSFLVLIVMLNVMGYASASSVSDSSKYQYSDTEFAELEELFYAIDALPQEVLDAGPEATSKWISEYTGKTFVTDGKNIYNPQGVVGCIAEVGLAIAENAFAFAKIAKIKDVIKAGGGIIKFIGNLVPAFKMAREDGYSVTRALTFAITYSAKDAGPELISAAVGFFSIGQIYSACFE
ncbi:hypothetical protein [Paenibacillus sp. NPDC055715]